METRLRMELIRARLPVPCVQADIRDAADMKATHDRKAHVVLQYITGNLQQLDVEERRDFLAIVADLASDAESQGESAETIAFLHSFGNTMGLDED